MSAANDEQPQVESGGMSYAVIRRERLRDWIKDPKHPVTHAELARKLQVRSSYVSSLIGANPVRNIGEKMARGLEQALGMPHLYLDGEDRATAPARLTTPIGESCLVPELTRRKNATVKDAANSLTLSTSILALSETRPENAAWVAVKGSEMAPSLPAGSIALIDTADVNPMDGKVYVFAVKDQFLFRRIHITPLGYALTADGGLTPPLSLSEAEFKSQIIVAGRIRLTLNTFQ